MLPEGFYFPDPEGEFWTPFVVPPYTPPVVAAGRPGLMLMMVFDAVARLAPGVSPEQASVEATTLLRGGTDFRVLFLGGGGLRGTVRHRVAGRGVHAAAPARAGRDVGRPVLPLDGHDGHGAYGRRPGRRRPLSSRGGGRREPECEHGRGDDDGREAVGGRRAARFYAVFAGGFAALALFLAAFGVYALLSYTVSQRRREIGVRMALGAGRRAVVALVVRQGAGLVATGIVLGLFAAAAFVRLLDSLLFGVAADDRLAFAVAPLVLAFVALVACWLPAYRAARIDPMDALWTE